MNDTCCTGEERASETARDLTDEKLAEALSFTYGMIIQGKEDFGPYHTDILHEAARRLRKPKSLPTEEAVKVTAADYNGKDWDGSPFSALPDWLKEAIEQGIVSIEPLNTDYALWRVVTVVGPGDQIVRASLASAPIGKTK